LNIHEVTACAPAVGDEQGEAGLALRAPSNLYELLGVDDNADSEP